MKSQDIFLLLKLCCLHKQDWRASKKAHESAVWQKESLSYLSSDGWQGWQQDELALTPPLISDRYSVRSLALLTGISKTEISASLRRCIAVGLAMHDPKTGLPTVNKRSLLDFIVHGLKYVFPAQPTHMVRGIPTAFAAPVMQGKLMSAGDIINVWPDMAGNAKGQSLAPLYKTVPKAVRLDAELYELLALVDAIRIGSPREMQLAAQLLKTRLDT